MSTFKGMVEEFPEIRIDYFRKVPGRDNPLACFLSHVHSDHLQGLESFHSPFIYCSPTTRELLLRLEKNPHRINLHRGILESRKQHYKHLSKLLKTIPLNTPAEIELKLGKSLRVTLLDANHCAGAVMFLIENDTKAILYTGDIRSEPWWINSLVRNPIVLPYTHGLRRLDKIYLDTTFASKKTHCRKFPTKADGLKELFEKVTEYPIDTVFHFHAWTFGYEEVWIALSRALQSQIHVDKYKYSLYESLGSTARNKNPCHEGSALYGFECGNRFQDGCLTPKQNVRLHSCQHEMRCNVLESSNTVYIRPIISRSVEGHVLPEVGAGRGAGDLNQVLELELELDDAAAVDTLIDFCTKEIVDHKTLCKTIDLITVAKKTQKMVISWDNPDLNGSHETIPLAKFARFLAKLVVGDGEVRRIDKGEKISSRGTGREKTLKTYPVSQELPRSIEFPYSRHSSYEELCDLVKAFKPVDVYPCTIDEDYMNLSKSIDGLFGHLCFGSTYAHDEDMKRLASQREPLKRRTDDRDSQSIPSPKEGTVDQRVTSPVSLLESASDPESHAFDDLERVPKRARTSPSFLGDLQGDHDLSTEVLSPRRKLPESEESLKSYVRQSKREKKQPTPKSWDPPSNHIGGYSDTSRTAISGHQGSSAASHFDNDPNANTLQNGRSAKSPVDVHRGTQAEPIELSDGDRSSQCNGAGDFLLEEMPEPDDIPNSLNRNLLDPETQVTLSDAAFESQSSHTSNPNINTMRLQKRKEAYKAVRESSGIWETDHGLISSNAHHGEEEVEL